MVNQTVVQIIGNRILNGGLNPKTNQPFQLSDVINSDYKTAVENYLIEKSGAV
ncbi:hypothetical protein [Clostridium aciditolerans]|uniref:Uncharacterized protein n=1 Tax=Clostridium aciditolerans TaxID=339861 RepID=A0A934I0E6_9CLOT|nr:hypothetical protein [Clostridium aciditolerans]MBI6873730.1 hypothetical protein [Clostridium aciditolerans]